MRRLLTIIIFAATFMTSMAGIKWITKEYDFGTIREASGPVTGSVSFVNTGTEGTFIHSVRPSCGCTGASYPHGEIAPGDTAVVTFTYNPIGRPGNFEKGIKIYVGEEKELTVAKIRGTVIGSPETLAYQYPHECGALRMDTYLLTTGKLPRGASRHLFINVYNQGEEAITPWLENDDAALNIEVTPREIAPGATGTITFYVNTKKEKHDGMFEYPVVLISDKKDKDSERQNIKVTGEIVSKDYDLKKQ